MRGLGIGLVAIVCTLVLCGSAGAQVAAPDCRTEATTHAGCQTTVGTHWVEVNHCTGTYHWDVGPYNPESSTMYCQTKAGRARYSCYETYFNNHDIPYAYSRSTKECELQAGGARHTCRFEGTAGRSENFTKSCAAAVFVKGYLVTGTCYQSGAVDDCHLVAKTPVVGVDCHGDSPVYPFDVTSEASPLLPGTDTDLDPWRCKRTLAG